MTTQVLKRGAAPPRAQTRPRSRAAPRPATVALPVDARVLRRNVITIVAVLVVVAGTTVKKTDAPFTIHIAEPDPGSSGSSGTSGTSGTSGSGGSSSGDDGGGCVVASSERARDPSSFAALALALAGLFVLRKRR